MCYQWLSGASCVCLGGGEEGFCRVQDSTGGNSMNVYECALTFVADVCPPHSLVFHTRTHNTHISHAYTHNIHTHTQTIHTHAAARTSKHTYTHTSVRARTLSHSLAFYLALSVSLFLSPSRSITQQDCTIFKWSSKQPKKTETENLIQDFRFTTQKPP